MSDLYYQYQNLADHIMSKRLGKLKIRSKTVGPYEMNAESGTSQNLPLISNTSMNEGLAEHIIYNTHVTHVQIGRHNERHE